MSLVKLEMQIIVKHVNINLQLIPFPHFFPGFLLHCLMSHIFVCSVCLHNGNTEFPLYLESLYQVCPLQPLCSKVCSDYLTQSADNQGLGLGGVPWVFKMQIYPRWHYSLAFEYVEVGEESCSKSIQGRTLPHWPGSSLYCRWSMQQVQLGLQFLSCSSPFLCPHPLPCTPVTCLPGSHILLAQLLFSVFFSLYSLILFPLFFFKFE